VGGRPRDAGGRSSDPAVPVLAVASAGLVNGLLAVVIAVSFAVLIFGASVPEQVGSGVTLVLLSTVIAALVFASRASIPGTIAGAQDNSSIVLALIAASVVAAAPATLSSGGVVATVVVTIGLATVLTGLTLLLLGRLRLGELIRYVPYPVIGGFLAGTGWLLTVGGLEVLLDVGPTTTLLGALLGAEAFLRWLPAVAVAAVSLALLRRSGRAEVFPAALAAMIVGFYAILVATGVSTAEARADGWLLGPFPSGAWPPIALGDLAEIDWGLVGAQAGSIASLIVITTLSLVLSSSGIEVAVGRDADLDRELETAGIANLLTGSVGGVVAYPYTALSVLSHRMGAVSRSTAVLTAGTCLLVLVVGLDAIEFVPVPVVGMILVLLGFSFLSDWLLDGWRSLPRSDYAVVVLIVAVIATAGLLPGIAAGLVLAVLLFVVRSSRVAVVKHVFTAACFASNVERRPSEREALRQEGARLLVLELQGFLFFGTASSVIREVAARRAGVVGGFVVLDLRRVAGIDSSAVFGFVRIARSVAASDGWLVLAGVRPEVRRQLEQGGLGLADGSTTVLPDVDRAVEWCEDRLLEERPVGIEEDDAYDAARVLGVDGDALAPYLLHHEATRGERLIEQGQPIPGLLIVTSGQVAAVLEHDDGSTTRLRVLRAGTIVGEIGFVLGVPATATIIAETDVAVDVLTSATLERMEHEAPQLSLALHRRLAQLASERLATADRTIDAALG
jgi:sulfate permease, SulP family